MDDETQALLDAVERLLNNLWDAGDDRDEDGRVYTDVAQVILALAAFPHYYVTPVYKEECQQALAAEADDTLIRKR